MRRMNSMHSTSGYEPIHRLVSSSFINSIHYDGHTLKVHFLGGGTATYEGVSESLVARFLNSSSKGEFYNAHIRRG